MGAAVYLGIATLGQHILVIASLMHIVKNSIEYFVFMFFSQLLKHLRNYKCEVCKAMYCCTAQGM